MLYKEKIKDNHILKNISWDIKKIKEADIKFIDGDRGKNYPSGNEIKSTGHCVFLDAKNITKFGFNIDKLNFIDLEKDSILKKGKLELNDIIITTRGTLNNIAWYSNEIKRKIPCARINSGMVIVRLGEKNDPNFINFFFKSKLWKEQCNNSGGVIPQLTIAKMNENYIIDVKIKEQKRIADVLSKQESIINKTKALIEQLDKRNTFMLDELLSGRLRIKEENGKMEFYKNPDDNWQTVLMNGNEIKIAKDFKKTSIENNCIWYSSGVALKSKEMLSEGKYPVIKMTDIKNGYIEKDFKVFTNKYVEKALLKRNDIVIGLSGSVGKIGIVKTDNDLILNQRCLAIRVKEYRTLILKILENSFKIWISSKIKAGVIPNISHKEVLDFNFSLPISNNELIYLDNFITSIFSEKERYEELLIEEQKKFDFLLEELMSGRLRIEE